MSPPDFTSEIVPIVYRNLDDEEKVTFENGAKVDSGKVIIYHLIYHFSLKFVQGQNIDRWCLSNSQEWGSGQLDIKEMIQKVDFTWNSEFKHFLP